MRLPPLPLPDITWTSASMGLGITDTSPTAASNEIAYGRVRDRNAWRGRCRACRHRALESWLGLKRSCGLAVRRAGGPEKHYQHQEADVGTLNFPNSCAPSIGSHTSVSNALSC